MYFIYILVIAVALLTILAALALVFGSPKSEKGHSLWFLLAAVGEAIWAISITVFLSLGSSATDATMAPWLVQGIYIGALVMDVAVLAYVSWNYKLGKILTVFFAIVVVVLATLLISNPAILYTEISLSNSGNSVSINMEQPFYIAYVIYFCALNFALCTFLIYRIRHTVNKKSKKGYLFFLIGLLATGLLSGVFDLLMPLYRYDLIWVGPLAIGLTILGFYFSILKFKIVPINSKWLKALSSVVIVSSAFIIYLLIFHLIFSALFRVANPSFQVILLNFIMIAIVLLLVPAFSEIVNLTKSLIMIRQIDLPYIVKKLSAVSQKKLDLKDISGFLSEHMHFSYVGFLIKGKLYVADDCEIPAKDLDDIAKLPMPERGTWQPLNALPSGVAKSCSISRIAILVGANGEVIGQMIFGRPESKSALERRDLAEVAMVVSLIGTMIDGGRSKS